MAKLVGRVTVVNPNGTAMTLFKTKRRKKRVSRAARPIERVVFHQLEGGDAFSSDLLRRHRRSRRKRRNGWLRHAGTNVLKAQQKGWKKLRRI